MSTLKLLPVFRATISTAHLDYGGWKELDCIREPTNGTDIIIRCGVIKNDEIVGHLPWKISNGRYQGFARYFFSRGHYVYN